MKYIGQITFLGDLKLILVTAWKVLKRADINREGTASDMDFGDYLLQKCAVSKEEYYRKLAESEKLF